MKKNFQVEYKGTFAIPKIPQNYDETKEYINNLEVIELTVCIQ